MAELGPPGVKSTGLWVYDGLRGMRDPPMACTGLGKARGGGFDGGGSSARRRSPEFTINGTPGVISTGSWVKDAQHAMRDRPRATARLGKARSGACCDSGGPV